MSDEEASEPIKDGSGQIGYRQMFWNAPLGYQSLDEDGYILDVNPAWTELLGYERDEVVGHHFTEFLDPAVAGLFSERFSRFKAAGEIHGALWRMREKSGRLRDLAYEGRIVRDAMGENPRTHCVVNDVTAVVRAQERLGTERKRLMAYLDLIEALVLALDSQGLIKFINRAGAAIMESSVEELVGQSWVDRFVPADEMSRVVAAFDALNAGHTQGAEYIENYVVTAKGNRRLIEWHNALLRENGEPSELLSFGIDVTDRRRTERQLRERSDLLSQSQEIAHLGSWELDLLKNALTWSDEAYRIFGVNPDTRAVTYETFLGVVHPEDREAVNEAYTSSVRNCDDGYEIEHRIVRADTGEIRVVLEKCSHYRDTAGTIVRSVGMTHDITEQKRAERELRNLNEDLEARVQERTAEAIQANKAKSEFLAAMSHELRTPLNSIIGFSGVLLSEAPGEVNQEQRQQLAMIQASGKRLLGLVNDILDLSKIEAGAIVIDTVETDLNRLCADTLEYIRHEASQKGISLVFEPSQDLCPRFEEALFDREKIEQILLNLLANAIKFTDEGEVRLTITCPAQDSVHLVVSDTGRGIDEASLDRVFDEFEQAGSHHEAKATGTGLGLAISRRLARAMDGDITVSSEVGVGSEFTVALPLRHSL